MRITCLAARSSRHRDMSLTFKSQSGPCTSSKKALSCHAHRHMFKNVAQLQRGNVEPWWGLGYTRLTVSWAVADQDGFVVVDSLCRTEHMLACFCRLDLWHLYIATAGNTTCLHSRASVFKHHLLCSNATAGQLSSPVLLARLTIQYSSAQG